MRLWTLTLGSCVWLLACGGVAPVADPSDDGGSTGSTSSESGEPDDTDTDTDTDTTETETGETGDPPGNLLLSDQVLNIAHRGGGLLRPEATLPAFEHALAVGADVLEFDLHASADGVIVAMHDDTVDRTTEGSGAIKHMSFAELRMLDAGYQFTTDDGESYPYRGVGIQIPTLEEILDGFPDGYYLMEIKQSEPPIVDEVLAILADHGVEDRVVIASFDQGTIDAVRGANPELFTAMTLTEMVDFYTAGAEPGYVAPTLFVQPPWDVVDQELVDLAHELGLFVHPWTVNGAFVMQDLLDLGVDGIMTDDPALLDGAIGG